MVLDQLFYCNIPCYHLHIFIIYYLYIYLICIELFSHRLKGDNLYEKTNPELDKTYIDVKGLKPEEVYEFIVVAVDGDTMKDSDVVEIEASSTGIFFNLISVCIY